MSDITALNVVGMDGKVPIYDPNARWCMWSINEIYLGEDGENRYIPKIDDYVIDPSTNTMYIVEHLDLVTMIPRLKVKVPNNTNFTFSDDDLLMGVGPGTQSDTYRVYIDKSTVPYTLAVDARLKVAGSMVKYCRIFRGSDLSTNGEVVSRMYNASGDLLGNTVALEVAAFNSHDNYTIKTVPVCKTMTDMPDGEIVVAVFYDDDGHVVSKRQLLVENTTFIRQAFNEDRFIVGIGIETPFMSLTFDNLIEFPLNVPLVALNIIGVVHYSDGTSLKLPIDNNKFKVYGLDQYVSTIVGQKLELVVSYTLSHGEAVYGATVGNGKFITRPYSMVTMPANNSYTVKVYGYPEWLNVHEGYRMRWFLLNLDRSVFTDVTPHVRFSEGTGTFDPTGYEYVQRKAISLNLNDVSGAYRNFTHTQLLDILLRGDPAVFSTPWEISQESIANRSLYGHGLKVTRNPGLKSRFTIHNDITTLSEWLDQVYYRTYPLVNTSIESRAPLPTYFDVCYLDRQVRYAISDWQNELHLGIEVPLHKNVYIKFIKQSGSGDIVLSVAAMIVKS